MSRNTDVVQAETLDDKADYRTYYNYLVGLNAVAEAIHTFIDEGHLYEYLKRNGNSQPDTVHKFLLRLAAVYTVEEPEKTASKLAKQKTGAES